MDKLPISEATLRQYASADSISRGRAYERDGAVTDLVQRGGQLRAQVQGSDYEPYRVQVTFDANGVTAATCTCPYDWGGWCKHIVATVLAAQRRPEAIEARPPLTEVLAGLERDQLRDLLLHLAAGDPDVADVIEQQVAVLRAASAPAQPVPVAASPAAATPRPPLDPRPVRRRMRSILIGHDYDDYGYAHSAVTEVNQIVEQARQLTAAGDAGNALRLLEAVTDEYTQHWFDIDDSDGALGGYFEQLGAAWIEALLAAELTPAERRQWAEKLEAWQAEADDYGVDDWLGQAAVAAEEGWDDADLQRVLRGELTEPDDWDSAPELTRIRLTVLERQDRQQEYLNLARAAGLPREYATMLARLGRVEEAVAAGLQSLRTAPDALALAQALHQGGEVEAAVRVAEHGLGLDEPRAPLAAWLTDRAEALGRRDLALRAAEVGFRSLPSLEVYRRVQALAGDAWPKRRMVLLDFLRRPTNPWLYADTRVDIFLDEGLIDDAIGVVKDGAGYTALERVMDAVVDQRPEWVIQAATAQAERIMDAGKADRYHYAVEWLYRARDAYQVAGREADWRGYLAAVREKHGRKYKLMGLLQRL